MKYLLVIIALLCSNAYAFNPNDIAGAEVKAVAPCNQLVCALVEKDGKQYVLMGELLDNETLDVKAIYIVEDKKLRQVWSITWRET